MLIEAVAAAAAAAGRGGNLISPLCADSRFVSVGLIKVGAAAEANGSASFLNLLRSEAGTYLLLGKRKPGFVREQII